MLHPLNYCRRTSSITRRDIRKTSIFSVYVHTVPKWQISQPFIHLKPKKGTPFLVELFHISHHPRFFPTLFPGKQFLCPLTNKVTQSWALINIIQTNLNLHFWIMDSHNIIAYLDAVYFPLCALYALHFYAAGAFISWGMWKVYHSNKSNLKWRSKVKLLGYQPVIKINLGWIYTRDNSLSETI